jgi:AAA15 family ATPase/GTPase
MKISYLKLQNFKNLKFFELDDIPDLVVLAGPNGVGKSSVLEAISFAKEVLAPYSLNVHISQFVTRLKRKVVSSDAEFRDYNRL